MSPARSAGFTLIELLIVVAIVSILTGLGVAGYRQYIQRANRVDAKVALLKIEAAQERFYLQHNRYASGEELGRDPPEGLGIRGTERGYYELSVEPSAGGLALGYTARASALPAGGQGDDTACWLFSIDERGNRGAADAAGATGPEITDRCWR